MQNRLNTLYVLSALTLFLLVTGQVLATVSYRIEGEVSGQPVHYRSNASGGMARFFEDDGSASYSTSIGAGTYHVSVVYMNDDYRVNAENVLISLGTSNPLISFEATSGGHNVNPALGYGEGWNVPINYTTQITLAEAVNSITVSVSDVDAPSGWEFDYVEFVQIEPVYIEGEVTGQPVHYRSNASGGMARFFEDDGSVGYSTSISAGTYLVSVVYANDDYRVNAEDVVITLGNQVIAFEATSTGHNVNPTLAYGEGWNVFTTYSATITLTEMVNSINVSVSDVDSPSGWELDLISIEPVE